MSQTQPGVRPIRRGRSSRQLDVRWADSRRTSPPPRSVELRGTGFLALPWRADARLQRNEGDLAWSMGARSELGRGSLYAMARLRSRGGGLGPPRRGGLPRPAPPTPPLPA